MAENETTTPLTEDQLALIDGWIKHAAQASASRVAKRATVGFVILLLGLGGQYAVGQHDSSNARKATVASGRAVAVDGCNRDFRSTDKFRGLLVRLKVANDTSFKASTLAFKEGKLTESAYDTAVQSHEAAVSFYETTLNDQRYPNCGNARSVVTDDPSKTIVIPRPLTTSDAQNADVAVAAKRISQGG